MTEKKRCDTCAGLKMQLGKLKKQLEQGERKDIPDLSPYVFKLDVMKNLLDNGDIETLKEKFTAEINNFKTLFTILIRDMAK